jgi:uncharacterized membrane protein YgdD (TMEM256/DUF423 family)
VTGAPLRAGLPRACLVVGALFMATGLALGAVGAHVVAMRVSPRELASYDTAVLYQLLHGVGLVLVGVVAGATGVSRRLLWSVGLMAAGVVLFCGSIYLATAGASRDVLAVAPAGGLAMMIAWVLLAAHAWAPPR